MSRMVRENTTSGLRERHWFAQTLFKTLQQQIDAGAPRGQLLALRGAVLFHLYSALVGVMRQAAGEQVSARLSLSALELELANDERPELSVLRRALLDNKDPVHWLHREINIACGAAGLASRPTPPAEGNELAVKLEDPNLPLASADMDRVHNAIRRVAEVLAEVASLIEEW